MRRNKPVSLKDQYYAKEKVRQEQNNVVDLHYLNACLHRFFEAANEQGVALCWQGNDENTELHSGTTPATEYIPQILAVLQHPAAMLYFSEILKRRAE